MKPFSPILLAVVFLAAVWSLYYGHFGGYLSKDPGDWGTFGDYTGGVVNPLLNFITIYLLIRSLSFQERQIEIAKDEAEEVKGDLRVARQNEALRSYENSLLVFAQVALDEFKSLTLSSPEGIVYKSGEAITYIQGRLLELERSSEEFEELVNAVDEQNHECVYSIVRSFSALFKLTLDLCPEEDQSRYLDMISLIIPTKAQYLLFMMEAYSKWKVLDHPRKLGFFDREVNKNTVEKMKALIKQ